MNPKIQSLREEATQKISSAKQLEEIEELRIHFLGKKGTVTRLMQSLKDLSPEEKPAFGKSVNELKNELAFLLGEKQESLQKGKLIETLEKEKLDITLPGRRVPAGKKHPLQQVMDQIIELFFGLGFSVEEGPEIETDYYNFQALNFPENHPARDMQDTLYVNEHLLLRTHTSPVQIRVMEKKKPPLSFIAPGKVYRHDADVTHSPVFHQVEGLMIDKHITFADLKGVLSIFLHELFDPETAIRFRPSFFPFTEPSAEVDISCVMCRGKGCRICKGTGWLEILGCGMVDPAVLKGVDINPDHWQGFAFGLGIERIAMLKWGINDIRLFFENDLRFLKQF